MKFLFACGGTAGHINPAVSMANLLRERHNGADILFVGATGGMEERLVPREGYPIETVNISGLKRGFSPKAIQHNVKVLSNMAGSLGQARKILQRFKPDVVVGTGGYASFPLVYAASKLGIPTAIHESNATPGLSNKLLSPHVDKVMVSMQESAKAYRVPVEVTGMPVREGFLMGDKVKARQALNLGDTPLVMSFFGSLGARDMNRRMVVFIKCLARDGGFRLLHAAGKFGIEWMPEEIRKTGVVLSEHPDIEVSEYIYDMPQRLVAADVAICRAGASTLSELMITGTPAILFPSPNVTNHQQEKNANVLAQNDAALVRMEHDTDGQALYEMTRQLLADEPRRASMAANLRKMAIPDAGERIYQNLMKLYAKSGEN